MSNLDSCDSQDLLDRFDRLIDLVQDSVSSIAPIVEKMGRYRLEMEVIATELRRRGIEKVPGP